MKITFINPRQITKYPQPPIGLALLAAVAEKLGHTVQIVDLNIGNEPRFHFAQSDLICLTSMTPTADETTKLLKDLKWLACKKVVGGVHPTVIGDFPLADYVILGEGENFLSSLVDRISTPKPVDSLDSIPYPAYHLLPMHRYRPHPPHGKYGRWIPMLTSRGCPYSCSFCSKEVFGTKYRHMSPSRIVEEIMYYISRFGIKEVCFYDDVFTMNESHILDLLKLLGPLGIKWSCETRVNLVNEQLLKYMKKAGCYSISYGLESGSQSILNEVSKGVTVEQNRKAIELTHSSGIETVGYFMIGSPGELAMDITSTIDFAKSIPLDYAQFAIATPLPGSKLYKDWSKTHTIPSWEKFRYEGGLDTPVCSDVLDRSELSSLSSLAYRQFYVRFSYIWNKLLSLRSFSDIKVSFQGLNMLLER